MRRCLSVCLVPLLACLNFFEAVPVQAADNFPTATPIKHVVVIFNENISFDHCFGTYPNALNLPGATA
jgi:phospholipase C